MFSYFKEKRHYFDYASTTPTDPRVRMAMHPYLKDKYANPSSLYKEGVETRKAVNEARRKVASVLQSKPEEIFFTSGGTESNNLAILGTYYHHKHVLKKDKIHFVTTSIEHASVLEVFEHLRSLGAKVTYISPEEDGIVSVKKIVDAIRPETVLVSVMYVNNEIGTIQPIREIGKMLKGRATFHVDACQAPLYLPVLVHDLHVDLLTLDGSKIYGPKGVGVLYKRETGVKETGAAGSVAISPIMFGGGQENGLRPGTENVAGIVGFASALIIAQSERKSESERLKVLRDHIQQQLSRSIKNLKINGDTVKRLPNNINVCLPGLDAEYAVLRMDALGFALSSVTSCKTLSEDSSSYVIEELYKDDSCSRSSLRITLGRFTKEKEVEKLISTLLTVIHK